MAGLYVIIAGAGKVGWNLARELLERGDEVTVIEQDRRRYLTVEQELEHAVQYGDATELWVLERAGIQRADLVVAVTGDDEDNLLICQVAKEKYLCERIIARCNNPRNLAHFKLLGIQPAVSATDLILRLIEHEVPRYGLVHLLDLPEERLEIIELVVGEGCVGGRHERGRPDPARRCADHLGAARRLGLRAEARQRRRRRGTRCSWCSTPGWRTTSRSCSSATTTMADRHVGALIVGGGAAAAACAESLHEGGFGEGVLLVGREPDPPYERPPCSKEYLAGKQDRDACLLHDADWYSRNGIELATRTSVMKLDTAARTATLSTKEVVEFGVALLATGANVRRLRVDGAQLSGIHYLRTLGTSDAIRADADQAERVVLIGGSYIACEVAATLTARGQHCTLVMLEDAPLSTTFGPAAGAFFADVLRSHGVELVTGDGLERLEGAERVERVVTASGRELPADMVVMGTGAMPDVLLARAAGLALGESGGVACAAHLETSAPGVFAAGDMCEWDSGLHEGPARIEHFEVAQAQGRAAAAGMLGRASRSPRCRTSGPTWPTGRAPSGSGSACRPSARSCAAIPARARSASCTSPAGA